MAIMTRFRIGPRLLLGYGTIAAILVILALNAIMNLSSVTEELDHVVGITSRKMALSNTIKDAFSQINVSVARIILANDRVKALEEKDTIDKYRAEYGQSLKELEASEQGDEGKRLIEKLKQVVALGREANNKAIELGLSGKTREAHLVYEGTVSAEMLKYREAANQLVAYYEKRVKSRQEDARGHASLGKTILLSGSSVAIVACLLLGMAVTRSITRPVKSLVAATEKLALGETGHKVDVNSRDEIGMLADSFRKMVGNVTALVHDTQELTEAAVEGRLSVRADASAHQGDFKRIVEGVNTTIGSLVGFLDAMPAPAMILDRDFNIRYINGIGARIGGRSPQQLIGTKCYDYYNTSDCKTNNCACYRAMGSGSEAKGETDAHPNGLNLEISYTAVAVKDGQGNTIGAFEVISDQTEIRQTARRAEKVAAFQTQETLKLTEGLGEISKGNFDFALAASESDSDTGEAKRVFEKIRDGLKQMGSNLRVTFKEITEGVDTLSSSSTQLAAISRQMSSGADQTSGKAGMVASAADAMSTNMTSVAAAIEEASASINAVATAVEEMTTTIEDVAASSEKARNMTNNAVTRVQEVTRQVNELGKAAKDIGKVTEIISSVCAQTNLLALNATIEAARAGSAGKGFAVVANEIKELAQQTASATEDIKTRIENIQTSSADTVADVEKISGIVQEVNDITYTIATAIEEQSAVTRDISNNVIQVAQGIEDVTHRVSETSSVASSIAQDMSEVNNASREISSSSSQVLMSAEDLSRLAEQLNLTAARFRV